MEAFLSPLPVLGLLRIYAECQILLCLSYGLFLAVHALARPRSAGAWVRCGQIVIAAAVAMPVATALLPKRVLLRPSAQIWTGGGAARESYALLSAVPTRPGAGVPAMLSGFRLSERVLIWGLGALTLGLGLAVTLGYRRRARLARFLRAQVPWKAYGRARVLIAPGKVLPFSAFLGGYAYVVLPAELAIFRNRRRWILRHEATHHRRGDTRWAHAMDWLRALSLGNPIAGRWAARLEELQELACDEGVVSRGGQVVRDYGLCLVDVARWSGGQGKAPGGTLKLAAAPGMLRRRIERMIEQTPECGPSRRWAGYAVLVAALAAVAFVLRSTVQDRRLGIDEGQRLARLASRDSAIPLDMNPAVLDRLNAYVGTAEGRLRVKNGLRRMPAFRRMIEAELRRYGLPPELEAIPLFESSFNNDAVSAVARAAGIWQFIAQTARRYGLKIDGGRDERVLPERETDAAMRYLGDLYRRFGDWRLAIKAFNEGERAVDRTIAELGTRDPWRLDRYRSPENYLSGAIAMMIVLKNPQILD